MFTNNWISTISGFLFAKTRSCKNIAGNTFNIDYSKSATEIRPGKYMNAVQISNTPATDATSAIYSYSGLYFGTGRTPATKEDFRLEAQITSGITAQAGSVLEYASDDNQYVLYVDVVLTNESEAEIAIGEIGLFLPASPSSGNKWAGVLMERTVLDEPAVIAPGKSKLITYKLTFNQS